MTDALSWWHLALLAPVALLAALWLWVFAAGRFLRVPEFFDEVHQLPTPDGSSIVLARLRPRGEVSEKPPVLLCHGLAMNRRAFALDPEQSFARALAELGRDVWVLELRGASPSRHPRSLRLATFDTYASVDVPLAIEQVRAATGAAEVDWVGFSMGGMLAYAHLGALGGGGVRRLVTIGSPVQFEKHPLARGLAVVPVVLAPLTLLTRTPFRFLSVLAAPLLWPGLPVAVSHGLRGAHYEGRSLRRVMANAMADVPVGVSLQFVRWMREGRFDSVDRKHDYLAGLAGLDLPTLVIAGSADRLATPRAVLDAPKRIEPDHVTARVVGRETGAEQDYDHLDLILGRHAMRDVFPLVKAWLESEKPALPDALPEA